ncbi:MAG: NAD(P)-binding protein [Candidatus Aenigmarchaeota archaeon]|nr:NAD(P)-binding protein [Candidatus Aenigmarchaeota archaeon]
MLGEISEVGILGAGLGGLAAAIKLADGGVKVNVFERKASVGSGFGYHVNALRDYGMGALYELHELGLDLEPCSRIQKVFRLAPGVRSETQGSSYVLFERGNGENSLENQLYRLCLEKGVNFKFNAKIPFDADEVKVVATGAPRDKRNILGVGYAYPMEEISLLGDELAMVYDNGLAPQGYVCLLPGSKEAMLLSVSFTELNRSELKKKLDLGLEGGLLGPFLGSASPRKSIFGYGYVQEDPISSAEQYGKLFVGESCGFQDARRGFGISYALDTGITAAQSILLEVPYNQLLRDRFGTEFQNLWAARQRQNGFTNEDYVHMLTGLGEVIKVNSYVDWKSEAGR